jgi:hypothetical protein
MAAAEERAVCRLRSLRNRCLPQDFAKFFSGRCHVALCGAGDADGWRRVRRAGQRAIEQAFASHAFHLP